MSTTTYTDTLMTSESASQPQLVIWGTNINMHRVKMKFQEFIKCYLVHDEQEQRELVKQGYDITEPYYMLKLDEVRVDSSPYRYCSNINLLYYIKLLFFASYLFLNFKKKELYSLVLCIDMVKFRLK